MDFRVVSFHPKMTQAARASAPAGYVCECCGRATGVATLTLLTPQTASKLDGECKNGVTLQVLTQD
jgi:hypothetical protein